MQLKVKIHKGIIDPRCDQIALDPIDYMCKKHNISMGTNYIDTEAQIHIRYRFPREPKRINAMCGVLIDDYPPAYMPRHVLKTMFQNMTTYDFYVTGNPRIADYLIKNVGNKPIINYPGLCCKEYFTDKNIIKPRSLFTEKRMAIINHGSYFFNIKDYVYKDWKLLYFYANNRQIPNAIWHPYTDIYTYYKTLSSFSPDIIIQPWYPTEGFYYKSNLKMREAVALNSCLVSQDLGNIYGIINGKNGFSWRTIKEFHTLLDNISLDEFRQIGLSHKDNDIGVLMELYQNLIELYRRIKK